MFEDDFANKYYKLYYESYYKQKLEESLQKSAKPIGFLKGQEAYKVDSSAVSMKSFVDSAKKIPIIKTIYLKSADGLVDVHVWNFSHKKFCGSSFTIGINVANAPRKGYWELSVENLSRNEYTEFVTKLYEMIGYGFPAMKIADLLLQMNAFGSDKLQDESFEELSTELPGCDQVVIHPVNKERFNLHSAIISLNDRYNWTRDQIADWIETLDEVPTFAPPEEVKEKSKELTITIIRGAGRYE